MLCSKDEQEFIDNEKDNQDGAAVDERGDSSLGTFKS